MLHKHNIRLIPILNILLFKYSHLLGKVPINFIKDKFFKIYSLIFLWMSFQTKLWFSKLVEISEPHRSNYLFYFPIPTYSSHEAKLVILHSRSLSKFDNLGYRFTFQSNCRFVKTPITGLKN